LLPIVNCTGNVGDNGGITLQIAKQRGDSLSKSKEESVVKITAESEEVIVVTLKKCLH
jgi:O-acetyl-ADP-ribose deacetylase (regulator of RNase III)